MNKDEYLEVKANQMILDHIIENKLREEKLLTLQILAKKFRIPGRSRWKHQNTFAKKISKRVASEWAEFIHYLNTCNC